MSLWSAARRYYHYQPCKTTHSGADNAVMLWWMQYLVIFATALVVTLLATPVAVWAIWLGKWISPVAAAFILAALYAGVSALLYCYLGRAGARRFEAL